MLPPAVSDIDELLYSAFTPRSLVAGVPVGVLDESDYSWVFPFSVKSDRYIRPSSTAPSRHL